MTIAFRTRRRAATEPRGSGSVLDPWRHVDWILMSATIVLAVIGAFNVFATTQQRLINQGFNPYFYVTRQVTFLIIAAVVLGGASIMGGYGTVFGTVLGVILISLIKNNLILLGVSGSWQRAAVGALLLIGITVQAINESRKAKNRRVSTNDEAA